jgi:hypothetical protein
MAKPTSYPADYYYNRPGMGGLMTRTKIFGPVRQHLAGGTTKHAVLTYLKKKHPGHETTLMSLEPK